MVIMAVVFSTFQTLATNKLLYKKNTWCDLSFDQPIELKKGDDFGEFNMGSTIVIIFEAPKNFEWGLHERQKIKYGERVAGQREPTAAPATL